MGTLPHTHLDILHAKTHFGGAAARLASLAGVWHARPAPRVAMLPGTGGANVRKTARYAGKDREPLRQAAPDTTRMLLTGDADLQSAISAVNEGQIFRFMTKPCAPYQLRLAFEAAVAQHRLVTAERVLLEQTVHGAVKTLTDILSFLNPA